MAYKRNRFGSIILGEKGNEFTLTKKEQKELDVLVKRANQRRMDKAERYYNGIGNQKNMEGISYEGYMGLLNQKGFITEKYTSNKNQFNSKDDIKDLLKELRAVTKKGYGNDRIDDIRAWMLAKVNENYQGNQDLMDRINGMKDNQLLSIYLHNDDIIKDLWGSSEVTEQEEEQHANKLHSDLNYWLKGTQASNRSEGEKLKSFNTYAKKYNKNGKRKSRKRR